MARRLWILAVLLFVFPAFSFADTVNIGLIAFETFSPGLGGSDVNVFNITNQTGDPLEDFPVVDPLTFNNSTLTLVLDDGTGTHTLAIALGSISPGGLLPPVDLQFDVSVVFYSAIFTATLSQSSFNLLGGNLFIPDSSDFSVELLPPGATTLTPGDLAVFTVSGKSVPPEFAVPEPSRA
jgi:hypothetical protein